MKERDKCTKFIHWVAKSHRRNNNIDSLLADVMTISNQKEIRDHIVNYYENLLLEQFSWRPRLDTLTFNTIGPRVKAWLERPFDEMEVQKVLKSVVRDKAPSSDGFTMAFF